MGGKERGGLENPSTSWKAERHTKLRTVQNPTCTVNGQTQPWGYRLCLIEIYKKQTTEQITPSHTDTCVSVYASTHAYTHLHANRGHSENTFPPSWWFAAATARALWGSDSAVYRFLAGGRRAQQDLGAEVVQKASFISWMKSDPIAWEKCGVMDGKRFLDF